MKVQTKVTLEVEVFRVEENMMALIRQCRLFRLCQYLICWYACKKKIVLSQYVLGKVVSSQYVSRKVVFSQ